MLTNLCSMFSPFLSHDHVLLHLHFAIMTILLTVSPTLVLLLTHSLFCYLFLANWSVHSPALNLQVYSWDRMYGLGFFSFNIIGLSSPLLPCRLVDLRRGLLYSEKLQHPPPRSLPTQPCPIQTALLRPTCLFIAWSAHQGWHNHPCHSRFAIECKLHLVSWSLLGL